MTLRLFALSALLRDVVSTSEWVPFGGEQWRSIETGQPGRSQRNAMSIRPRDAVR
jgi:hypothetical protein